MSTLGIVRDTRPHPLQAPPVIDTPQHLPTADSQALTLTCTHPQLALHRATTSPTAHTSNRFGTMSRIAQTDSVLPNASLVCPWAWWETGVGNAETKERGMGHARQTETIMAILRGGASLLQRLPRVPVPYAPFPRGMHETPSLLLKHSSSPAHFSSSFQKLVLMQQ